MVTKKQILINHINEQIQLKDAYGLTNKGQGYLEGLVKALLIIDDNATKFINYSQSHGKVKA